MRTDIEGKVLERTATSDKVTIVAERQPDGKMRVSSGSWGGEKVFLRDQVLEIGNVDGRLHIARKPRNFDEWDTSSALHVTAIVSAHAGPALHVTARTSSITAIGGAIPADHKGGEPRQRLRRPRSRFNE